MFLDIHDLERQPISLDQVLPPRRAGEAAGIDFGEDVWQVEPLIVHGSAELLAGEIRLRGDLQTVVEVPCARCLERTRLPVAMDFDLFYRSVQTIAREEEVEIKGDDLAINLVSPDDVDGLRCVVVRSCERGPPHTDSGRQGGSCPAR